MKQTVDALWICIFRPHSARERRGRTYSIFCVRLCKFARSTEMGNTRASDSGTSKQYGSHAFFFINQLIANAESPAALSYNMDFSFPEHNTTGFLSGEDLQFFYYDVGLDHQQGWPCVYDWDSVVDEFKGELDIEACSSSQMPANFTLNNIRFTVSNNKKSDNGSKSAAFFRHLRNAFAHYTIVREGDNYVLTDCREDITMYGLVNADLLKRFCFRFFDVREKILSEYDDTNNPTL